MSITKISIFKPIKNRGSPTTFVMMILDLITKKTEELPIPLLKKLF